MKQKEQLTRNEFHFKPYLFKKNNPMPGSCAVCANRPIDFCRVPNTHRHRINPEESWKWKDDVTDEEVFEAQKNDALIGTHENEDALKVFRKCKTFSWSRATPFYNLDHECFEAEEDD